VVAGSIPYLLLLVGNNRIEKKKCLVISNHCVVHKYVYSRSRNIRASFLVISTKRVLSEKMMTTRIRFSGYFETSTIYVEWFSLLRDVRKYSRFHRNTFRNTKIQNKSVNAFIVIRNNLHQIPIVRIIYTMHVNSFTKLYNTIYCFRNGSN